MAKFVYVFRGGAVLQKGLSATGLQDHLKLWGAWMGELAKQGHQPAGQRVQLSGRTIRGKSKVVTDGPYAELKDLITGHLAIEAASLDVATELARQCPIFLFDGSVEDVGVHLTPERRLRTAAEEPDGRKRLSCELLHEAKEPRAVGSNTLHHGAHEVGSTRRHRQFGESGANLLVVDRRSLPRQPGSEERSMSTRR